jgi:hypothetical protein
MSAPQAYPLLWPVNWPRTTRQQKSQFKTSLNGSLANVKKSLQLLATDSGKKVEGLTISSNVTLGEQTPTDAGVAVYFTWDGIATCIPVDRYVKVQDNLQAIHHCIEADRTKLRHGGIHQIRATYRGYASLPAPESQPSLWWQVLGISRIAGKGLVEKQYKMLRSLHHEDHGGDRNKYDAVQNAYAAFKKERDLT